MHLKHAQLLVNPPPDPITGDKQQGVSAEDVKRAIIAVIRDRRRTHPNWTPHNLLCVTWQTRDGKSYFEQANEVPPPPPLYERIAFLDWLDRYGDRAFSADRLAEIRKMVAN